MSAPLVSVVVSACDRPEMFKAALDSVLNQTLSRIEIIIQDDSSNDGCEQIANRIGDDRIRYSHNRPRLGTAVNLRNGYRLCKGKYISTLNDDDFYAATYLETMVSILEANPGISLAFSDHFVVDSSGNVLPEATDQNSEHFGRSRLKEGIVPDCVRAALISQVVPGMFAVFRADAIELGDFPEEVSSGYDYWMTYLGVREGKPIYYCPERLTYYRAHPASQSASFANPIARLRNAEYETYIYRRMLGDSRIEHLWPEVRGELAEMRADSGYAQLRLRRRRKAWNEFAGSVRTRLNLRGIAGSFLTLFPFFIFDLLDRKR